MFELIKGHTRQGGSQFRLKFWNGVGHSELWQWVGHGFSGFGRKKGQTGQKRDGKVIAPGHRLIPEPGASPLGLLRGRPTRSANDIAKELLLGPVGT